MKQHYYLTGFMGSGKTTIGQALANELSFNVIDTDQWIEEQEKQRISELFQTKGEPYFRKQETKALETIAGQRLIITTGGGIVIKEENRQLMKEKGNIIYLKCDIEEILRRLQDDETRPLLQGKDKAKIEQLFLARKAFYEDADIIIDTTGRTVNDIINELKMLIVQ
ncbi:shikimate kinase [Halalkalibacter oceani]